MNAKSPLSRYFASCALAILLGGGLLLWLGPRPVADLWIATPAGSAELTRVQTHTWEEVAALGEPLSALLPAEARSGLFFDADNDGDLDVVVRVGPTPDQAYVQLFLRLDSGYREVADRLGSAFAMAHVFDDMMGVDVNGDGRLDVALLENGDPVTILVNRFHRLPFLKLHLTATPESPSSNLTVRVDRSDRTILRQINEHHWSANRPLHIGLGAAPPPMVTVTVKWPDGEESRFAGLLPNNVYRIIQSKSAADLHQQPRAQADE